MWHHGWRKKAHTVHAESVRVQLLAGRADASLGRGVEDEASGAVADTASIAINDEASVGGTRDAVSVLVEGVTRRANAVLVLVKDEALAGWTSFHWEKIFEMIRPFWWDSNFV